MLRSCSRRAGGLLGRFSAVLLAGLALSAAHAADLPKLTGPSSGGIYEAMLPNGMKVLMKESHTSPLMCVSIWYRAGSAQESNGTTGLAHLLEHMMFKGTAKYGKGVYDRLLEGNGAINNASTWLDRTNYFVVIAADKTDLAMELEADRVRGALFTQQDLDDEMPVVRNEMEKGEDNPYGELSERLGAMAILEHPYHWPTIGWKTDVEAITAEQIHEFYNRYYWPNNATLILVGDLPVQTMLEKAVHHFAPLPSGGQAPNVVTVEPPQKGERRFLIREAGQNRIVSIAYRVPSRSDADSYAMDVVAGVLGDGKSSRLYRALVESGLATDVSASNTYWFRDPYLFSVDITLTEDASVDSVEATVYREIARLQSAPPSDEEVQRAVKQAKVETLFERDDIISTMFAIGEIETCTGWSVYDTYLETLAEVEPADVSAAAAKYLTAIQRTVGFYLPDGQPGGSWTSNEEGAATTPRGRSAETTPTPTTRYERAPQFHHTPESPRLPEFHHTPETPRVPEARTTDPSAAPIPMKDPVRVSGEVGASAAAPVRLELDNGITLIVLESHDNPTLEIRGRLEGGMLTEPVGKEGVAALCAAAMTLGTEEHSPSELAQLLESNGITIDVRPGRSALSVSARSLSEDFPLLMDLLGEVLLKPSFEPDQIEIARERMLSRLRDAEEDTYARAERAAMEQVYGEGTAYSRFVQGTTESLNKITRDDIVAYHRAMLAGRRFAFALVGDVSTEDARKRLTQSLGSAPAGEELAVAPPPFKAGPGADRVTKLEMPDKSQVDLVFVGEGVPPNDPARDAADLANVVLGGSFTSRLNSELRDNEGLTYGAGSDFEDRDGSTLWCANLGVNPENVGKGLDGVRRELKKIVDPGVTAEELKKAREYAAGSFPIRLQSKGAVAEMLLYAERFDLGLDYVSSHGARMRAVTDEQVKEAVRRFTDPKKLVVVSAGSH